MSSRCQWAPFMLLGLVACAAPQAEAGVPHTALAELRRLADVSCPYPPQVPTLDGTWYRGVYGRVVAIDGQMFAVRPDDQAAWRDRDRLGVVMVMARIGDDIKGDGVVLGAGDGLVLCRYFPQPAPGEQVHEGQQLHVGDQTYFDHATTRTMRTGRGRGER